MKMSRNSHYVLQDMISGELLHQNNVMTPWNLG